MGAAFAVKEFLRDPASEAGPNGGASDAAESTPFRSMHSTLRRRPVLEAHLVDEIRNAEGTDETEAPTAMAPLRALALATEESDPEVREALFQAILCDWGSTDPEAAIQWARMQQLIDFTQAIASIFHGAVGDPEEAVMLAKTISEQDPEHARDYGASLIAALGHNGDFNRAAAFAAESSESARLDLLTAACDAWANKEPHNALDFVARLSPEVRRDAFNAVISRWANTDAISVAEYALTLDSTDERAFAISAAMRVWSAEDAADAADWVNRLAPAPELDLAAAAIASHPCTLNNPDTALSWADSIVDRPLRMRTLATVLNQWAATDALAARNHAAAMEDLSPDERLILLSAFHPDFEPVSFLP